MTDKDKLDEIRKILEVIMRTNHTDPDDFTAYEDAVTCGNADDTYDVGFKHAEKGLAVMLLEILNGEDDDNNA